MRIDQCLEVAVAGGEIDRAQATELSELFGRYVEQYERALGPAEARRRAQADLANRLETEATQRKRAALLQLEALERLEHQVFTYRNARGEIDPAVALKALIENHGPRSSGFSSIEGRRKAILAEAHAELEELLHTFERSFITGTTPERARLENVVRELFGEDTGDAAAKALAEAWAPVAERLRKRYNEMGGAIGKLENWGLPQRHDGRAIRMAGFQVWREFINDRLEWDDMRHHLSGDPILESEREEVLKHIYDTLTTEGWAHRDPTMTPKGRGALVRQHAESRFLKFKSADDWLAYQKQFGEGNAFAAMMGHLNIMARDIATMEILGPNPDAAFEWLKQAITKEAHLAARGDPARFAKRTEMLGRRLRDPVSYANGEIALASRMYDIARGTHEVAVNQIAADVSGATRNLVTAASLGSAMLSAVTDPGFGAIARRFAAGPTGDFSQASDIFTTLSDTASAWAGSSRRGAVRAELILDSAAHVLGEQARYAAAQTGAARFLADRVITWQGLHAWTQSGRHGFGLFMQGAFADQKATPWRKMQPDLQRTLGRYGIDETDWEVMRKADLHDLYANQKVGPRKLNEADRLREEAVRQAERDLHLLPNPPVRAGILRPREIRALTPADLGGFFDDQQRIAARRFLDDVDRVLKKRKRLSMAELIEMADEVHPDLTAAIRKFALTDMDEVRQTIARLSDDRRYEAGSLPSDGADYKMQRYLRQLGDRYAEVILQETDYAVPQATVMSRAVLTGEGRPGTATGELTRFFSQFKSFGAAVWMLHVHRIGRELAAGNKVGGARYAGGLLITTTLLGAMALQLKALRDGKDPQEMTNEEFWTRAMMQGGGVGIWGDFLLADTNRFGGSWGSTLLGPTVGRAENLWNLTAGNLKQLATDKDTNFGRELTKFLDANTPVASIWYMRLAWQRVVLDQLQKTLDPEAAQAFARRRAYAAKQQTSYWWEPGDNRPDRAPDWGRSLEHTPD